MSDDFHRPTYTTTPLDVHGAFNATQVRLYGIPGLPKMKKENSELEEVLTGVFSNKLIILTDISKQIETISGDIEQLINNLRDLLKSQEAKSNSSYVFVKSVIKNYMIMLGSIDIVPSDDDPIKMSVGIIFGYAYEGHTYDLPKPKIMMIPANPERIPDDDSGYDLKSGEGYMVWIVDKLDQCVEIDVNQGFIEQIVLEANLPGKRAPTMYAGRMMMGHRSGRLSE
jgi:hypothetical protein